VHAALALPRHQNPPPQPTTHNHNHKHHTTTHTHTTTTTTHQTTQATKIIYVISWVHLDGAVAGNRDAVRAVYDEGRARVAHLCDLVSSERVPSLPPGKISMALAQRPSSPGRCVSGRGGGGMLGRTAPGWPAAGARLLAASQPRPPLSPHLHPHTL
jgi:hypothetical protein